MFCARLRNTTVEIQLLCHRALDRTVRHASLPLHLRIRNEIVLRGEVLRHIGMNHGTSVASSQEGEHIALDTVRAMEWSILRNDVKTRQRPRLTSQQKQYRRLRVYQLQGSWRPLGNNWGWSNMEWRNEQYRHLVIDMLARKSIYLASGRLQCIPSVPKSSLVV